jgi:hypothetical protein
MEDRTRRIVFGIALTAGALILTATTAGAQSTGSPNPPAPHSSLPFDDGPTSGSTSGSTNDGSMYGGCHGMDMPDTGGASGSTGTGGTASAAQLT